MAPEPARPRPCSAGLMSGCRVGLPARTPVDQTRASARSRPGWGEGSLAQEKSERISAKDALPGRSAKTLRRPGGPAGFNPENWSGPLEELSRSRYASPSTTVTNLLTAHRELLLPLVNLDPDTRIPHLKLRNRSPAILSPVVNINHQPGPHRIHLRRRNHPPRIKPINRRPQLSFF
jgi:hypothetical protein